MNESSAARIRASFDAFSPRLDVVVDRLYQRLFELHPPLRAMFPADMGRQQAHLSAALAVICRNVDRLEMLEEPLMALGAQHVGFGTLPEHYPSMRDALIGAIADAMGEQWSRQLEADWTAAMNTVITLMLKGHARAVLDVANSIAQAGTQSPQIRRGS